MGGAAQVDFRGRLLGVFEESVESFIAQWRPYAAQVELFAHLEGSPLLECGAAGVIFGVLERTGPYLAHPGKAQLILHPVAERVVKSGVYERSIKVTGLSQLQVQGVVLLRRGNMVVVDAGAPLVTGSFAPLPDDVAAGNWLKYETLPPVHGFVVTKTSQDKLLATESEI